MRGKMWAGLLIGIVGFALVAVGGCSTTSSSGTITVTPGDVTTVGTSEATLSGTIAYSSGTMTISLNAIIISGEAVSGLTSSKFKITTGTTLADIASWSSLEVSIPTTKPSMDIAFILDNTGSMGGGITGAKNSIVAFAASLEAEGATTPQFGLVTFGDSALHPTPAGYITAEGFTDATYVRPVMNLGTASALRAILSSEVYADGGGDGPENPLNALLYAYNNFTWRSGAQKIFIVITDINAHQSIEADTASGNKCTVSGEAMVNLLAGKGVVYAVSPNYTTSQHPYFDVRRLADGLGEGRTTALSNTGGKWIQYVGSGFDLTTLGIDTTATSGYTINVTPTFTAGTWYIYIQVDTDGDGIYDSNMLVTLTITSASSAAFTTFGPQTVKADAALKADDWTPRNN